MCVEKAREGTVISIDPEGAVRERGGVLGMSGEGASQPGRVNYPDCNL